MNKYVELCKGKPSNALQAMTDGLKATKNMSIFEVEMSTFGYSHPSGLCFGCAATCAVAQLTDIEELDNPDSFLYDYQDIGLTKFESAINEARLGNLGFLFHLFETPPTPEIDSFTDKWVRPSVTPLRTLDWEEKLPAVQTLIDELRELGY